ncbi:GntR family transcriptional regulator [Telmatospirillum siberiense]|uniref:GntR family transcriptional regulator n=2 Tax=Telmatospirillum siberiense TaxID=382514 RepID=A0A2N3PV33_9PROT|nr:GntR family transcriptional regulator [Telmatospirillum siberiense]
MVKAPLAGSVLLGTAPIRRASLHDEIVLRLREMILTGSLPAGNRVPEAHLCETLGISRTPLREALKVLASEGLIELRPNRGSVVAEIDATAVQAMFEIMESFEEMIGVLACRRASDAELRDIDDLHQSLKELHRTNDLAGYFHANQTIHLRIMEAAHNPVLVPIYEGLSIKIRRARYMANYDAMRWRESLDEHEKLNAALQNRDASRLAVLLREHMRVTGEAVIKALDAPDEELRNTV